MDGRTLAHADAFELVVGIKASVRESVKHRSLLGKSRLTRGVGGEAARVKILRKEYGLIRSVNRSPVGDTTLEGAPGRFIEPARMLALKISKQGNGLQSRFGLEQLNSSCRWRVEPHRMKQAKPLLNRRILIVAEREN